MKVHDRWYYILFFYFFCLCPDFLIAQQITDLKAGFRNPPSNAYPKTYWWWLNGRVDTVRIKEEMLAMKAAGLTGFDIFEIGVPAYDTVVKPGPPFMENESLQAIKIALEMAKTLDMTAGLNLASSWNAGGAWTSPENSAKSIYYSVTNYTGQDVVKLAFPPIDRSNPNSRTWHIKFGDHGRPVYYEEVLVLAIPRRDSNTIIDTSQIINLTPYFDPQSELLKWSGQGDYEIYRYICSNSGEQLKLPSKRSAGPIIDHFDANATKAHFEYIIDKLKTILPEGIGNSALKSLYLASYEATGFTWTPTLPAEFKRLNGYAIDKLIPALFDQQIFDAEIVDAFNRDFRRTLSELMINHFYRTAKEISNQHGLKINSESGGPGFPLHNVPVEPLKSLGVMDLPRGEFWINHNRLNDDGIDILRVVKEVSSAAHIYGRRIIEEESFTTFQHWQEGPYQMKPAGDRAFCEGMNKVVVHGFSHNPRGSGFPGIVYSAGTHFNDKRVWWTKVKPFNDYLARLSFIAQESDFFADVLFYYGDAIPNFAGHKNGRFIVGPGYDYEVINTEIFKQLTFEDSWLKLPTGARFKVLVMESEAEIHPEVFQKISTLVKQGAIIISEKPEKVMQRKELPQLQYSRDDLDKLWTIGEDKSPGLISGRGRVLAGVEPEKVLKALGLLPDFTYDDASLFLLDYIHYQKDDLDFYFLRNTTDQWISRNARFRQSGKSMEVWNPVTGEINPVRVFRQEDHYSEFPISLAPYGSLLVVFSPGMETPHLRGISAGNLHSPLLDHGAEGLYIWEPGVFTVESKDHTSNISNHIKTQTLEGAWELFFPKGWGAPERVIIPELISWTKSELEGIKYFSGTATYKKTFQYEINSSVGERQKMFLDLGDLTNVAEVWLNGQSLGITWTKPYRFDVTKVLKPGDNFLVVEVANTWSNRLKGDALTGGQFTHTNITATNISGLNKIRVPWAEVPLIEAGLFGPVTINTITPIF